MLTDEWIKKYDTYHKSIYLATHTQYIILYSTILSSLRKEGNLAICDNLQGIIFWAHGDFSYEIKRCLLLVRKTMTNMDSVLKSRDITLPTKVCLIKAVVFPVVMYGCENRTVKKAECWRIDAFELWYWRRLLRILWTANRSNQSIPKISPGISLERMMLKVKLQYFGCLMRSVDSLEKILMLGEFGGRRRRGRQRMR